MITPNSIMCEGVPLKEWLWRLVGDDGGQRDQAGLAIMAMRMGLPSPHTDLATLDAKHDVRAKTIEFDNAVRELVGSPDFDTATFVPRLCKYRMMLSREWQKTLEKDRKRANSRILSGSEATGTSAAAAHMIFECLDSAFLAAPDSLNLLFEDRTRAAEALQAIARIGPAAKTVYIEPLLKMISEPRWPHLESMLGMAIGKIAGGDTNVIDALLAHLDSRNAPARITAAVAFEQMGSNLAGRERMVIEKLRKLVPNDDPHVTIPALAAVGQNDPDTRRYILELARPQPPVMVTVGNSGYRYDKTMLERGMAISSLEHFTDYPSECVPVLVDALDTFEEFDPDEGYFGEAARIARAMLPFAAHIPAEAVPKLAAKLTDSETLPKEVLKLLGAMGPRAAAALPATEALRIRLTNDPVPTQPEPDDVLAWTILKMRGHSEK